MRISYTFSFNIPRQIYRFRWKNVKNYVLYWMRPVYCHGCDKRMVFKHFHVKVQHKLTVQDLNYKTQYCQHCLADLVAKGPIVPGWEFQNKFDRFDVSTKCDVCYTKVKSYKILGVDTPTGRIKIHFCRNSWNSSYVCVKCTEDVLRNGEVCNDQGTLYYGKCVDTNHYGLPVVDGKVKFPYR